MGSSFFEARGFRTAFLFCCSISTSVFNAGSSILVIGSVVVTLFKFLRFFGADSSEGGFESPSLLEDENYFTWKDVRTDSVSPELELLYMFE